LMDANTSSHNDVIRRLSYIPSGTIDIGGKILIP
jgi:hypothetical protein